jgi:hypothetical protein
VNDLNRIFTPVASGNKHLTSFSFLLLALAAMVLILGCGQQGISGSNVSGHVTVNDSPLPDGVVMFVPQSPAPGLRTVSAKVTSGEFSISPDNLLMPGSYRVLVTAEKKTGRRIPLGEGSSEMIDELVDYIPPEYNTQTTLTAEIKGDTSDLSFPLQVP